MGNFHHLDGLLGKVLSHSVDSFLVLVVIISAGRDAVHESTEAFTEGLGLALGLKFLILLALFPLGLKLHPSSASAFSEQSLVNPSSFS